MPKGQSVDREQQRSGQGLILAHKESSQSKETQAARRHWECLLPCQLFPAGMWEVIAHHCRKPGGEIRQESVSTGHGSLGDERKC